jgi:hypothetical protein
MRWEYYQFLQCIHIKCINFFIINVYCTHICFFVLIYKHFFCIQQSTSINVIWLLITCCMYLDKLNVLMLKFKPEAYSYLYGIYKTKCRLYLETILRKGHKMVQYASHIKGSYHQIIFDCKWYGWIELGWNMWCWTFKYFALLKIYIWPSKFFCDQWQTLTNSRLLWKTAGVDTSRLIIST